MEGGGLERGTTREGGREQSVGRCGDRCHMPYIDGRYRIRMMTRDEG